MQTGSILRLFSYKNRPVHMGPYPLERLQRTSSVPDLAAMPSMQPMADGVNAENQSIVHAMAEFSTMLDVIRDGIINNKRSEIPADPTERSNHLKATSYFFDASQVAICKLPVAAILETAIVNPGVEKLSQQLQTAQPKTLASGIDVIMADLREAAKAKPSRIDHHKHALVIMVEHPRQPEKTEPGTDWIFGTTGQRSALRAAEIAVVLANYLRLLGFEARAHTASSSDVDLPRLAVASGLALFDESADQLQNSFIGSDYSLAALTTTLELKADLPLAKSTIAGRWRSHGLRWLVGYGSSKTRFNHQPYASRQFWQGAMPFETLKRVDKTTTYIDEPNVARVPKRTDMFARALFGDMGKPLQEQAKNGHYLTKNPLGTSPRRALGAMILLQDGDKAAEIDASAKDLDTNAKNIKAALYFLGADAVGLSRCPDWTYYSHDAAGDEIKPYHKNAISLLIDQGHESMEGASGDDWLSGAQSMRAYLRGSILGGVVASQIRRLGYSARVHSVVDGEVLQPPLLLLSGLGEVSRIGEVILHPFLGPRLKSAVITTDMPFTFDKPIDFGLQNFCESCNKCARECPAGAITAGPKLMFNGYEIWKSDSEKCARYRVGQTAGSLCGRCMKTCPWNLEGLIKEAPFRWAAMNIPQAASLLAKLDDVVGNGSINKIKKWWWDLEIQPEGHFAPAKDSNARELQRQLDLKYKDQTLAVYPAPLAPHPWPFPFLMDREKGIAAYQAMISAGEYKKRLIGGNLGSHMHKYKLPTGETPVLAVKISRAEVMADNVTKFEFSLADGGPLPEFQAGAHLDVVIAPEFLRQYSMSGNPNNNKTYQIGVLREEDGRGGSALMHRIFSEGRRVFISRPINHFELAEDAKKTLLMAGGIGVTPLIAMAHRLNDIGAKFELHYSCHARKSAGFLDDLAKVDWKDRVKYYFSDGGKRADLGAIIGPYHEEYHLYTCGPDRYMSAVLEQAEKLGWLEENLHREYFSVPEQDEWVNHPFRLRLARSNKVLEVPAHKSATDVLAENGFHVDTKCSDGICGVCSCDVISGSVEHRDFVLGKKDRESKMILCSSRATEPDGEIVIDM